MDVNLTPKTKFNQDKSESGDFYQNYGSLRSLDNSSVVDKNHNDISILSLKNVAVPIKAPQILKGIEGIEAIKNINLKELCNKDPLKQSVSPKPEKSRKRSRKQSFNDPKQKHQPI